MQNVVVDQPYQFIPPVHGTFWPTLLYRFLPGYLRRSHGVTRIDLRETDRLRRSLDAGHGVMLAPNHCRPCDPMVLVHLGHAAGHPPYIMGSWHVFMQSRIQSLLLRCGGVFSVYREGLDREALKCAVQILAQGQRPLILFPEGVISRTNDQLNNLMEGTAFIARNAAKLKAAGKQAGGVVIHPVAIRYFFDGDVDKAVRPVLEEIEKRLSWKKQAHLPTVDRIVKIGYALLTLKEIEYFGEPKEGELKQRLTALIDRLLVPLEEEWLKGIRTDNVVTRVKNLRAVILPDMTGTEISEDERARRWHQLADLYLAQQLSFYPPDYFQPVATPEKILETVERFEEDLTDVVTIHTPIRAVVEVGEAIEVNPVRQKGADGDPIMIRIRQDLESMLARLREERP